MIGKLLKKNIKYRVAKFAVINVGLPIAKKAGKRAYNHFFIVDEEE